MTNVDEAKALGRRFNHIVRARQGVFALHVALGTVAFCAVNFAVSAGMQHDWWWRPLLLHMHRVPIFSPPWFVIVTGLFGPVLVYLASWLKVKDSLLEKRVGAVFWLALSGYGLLATTVSIASDWLCVWTIKPPLCFVCLIGTLGATFATLRLLPKFIERIAAALERTSDPH